MKIFPFLVLLFVSFSTVQAQAPSLQEACFQTLQQNIAEVESLSQIASEIQDKSYADVEGSFSPYYKNMSSFGVTLNEPLFDMRIYDWGEQTGYIHPPQSPFPASTKTDKWNRAAKQNIYAEEYIRDENGDRQFLGCAYFLIAGTDLAAITRDRYLYDGELMSAIKITPEYKAWYNENFSFDLDGKHFVTWKRLFVYPESTQNDYFDKYSVIESVPANNVESFAELSSAQATEDGDHMEFVAYSPSGKINVMSNDALQPVRWPENEVFAMNTYYQAIEAQFPEFEENLSIHGAVSYETYKDLISHRDETKQSYIWSVAHDTRDVTRYYIQREKGEVKKDEVFEAFLDTIPKLEQVVAEKVRPYVEEEETAEETQIQKSEVSEVTEDLDSMETEEIRSDVDESSKSGKIILALILVAILLLLGKTLLKHKKD